MFFGFLAAVGLSAVFVKIGALSVWVSVLKVALLLALFMLVCAAIVLCRRNIA